MLRCLVVPLLVTCPAGRGEIEGGEKGGRLVTGWMPAHPGGSPVT